MSEYKVADAKITYSTSDKISKASVSWEAQNPSQDIKEQDLPFSYGQILVSAINDLNKKMIESNAADIQVKIVNMMDFYGNTLTIKLERYQDAKRN
jgi:hypothetical protein